MIGVADSVIWASYTFRTVALGSVMLGALGGLVGCFALLRRQSLLGDALAHAALPGVCLGFLIAGTKSTLALSTGALIAGLLGALLVVAVVRGSRVKEDAAIGIVLSVFFGAGIVLLTRIQKSPSGNASGLDRFLFGQAATLTTPDLWLIVGVLMLVLLAFATSYRQLKLATFDRGFARSIGLPVWALEIGLTGVLVLAVVVGLQLVGVVLMVATLITPAAAARQWTHRLSTMLLVAAGFGAAAGGVGAMASASIDNLPTGPAIVVCSSVLLGVSLLAAPQRGVLFGWLAQRRVATRVRFENLLKDLYRLGEDRGDLYSASTWPLVLGSRRQGRFSFARRVRGLERNGLVMLDSDQLRLTAAGVMAAEGVVRRHRLWELYLAHRLELPVDHLHRDAEAMEHALSDEALDDIEAKLGYPTVDPHGRPIPPRRR
jgi:manganese/zinc/iron transport system permease protein